MDSTLVGRLSAHIDLAVPPLGGPPKITGPQLNGALQEMVQVLSATYRASLLFAQGDDLVGPDYHPGPAALRAVALSPGAVGLAISLDGGATFSALPLAAGARTWQGTLPLPAEASVWYQVAFAAGASSAGAVLTIEEPAASTSATS